MDKYLKYLTQLSKEELVELALNLGLAYEPGNRIEVVPYTSCSNPTQPYSYSIDNTTLFQEIRASTWQKIGVCDSIVLTDHEIKLPIDLKTPEVEQILELYLAQNPKFGIEYSKDHQEFLKQQILAENKKIDESKSRIANLEERINLLEMNSSEPNK